MSTITPTHALTIPAGPGSSLTSVPVQGDPRTVFRGVDWHAYNALSEATVEGEHVRLAYDGKDLEIIMVTSNVHEHWKELLIKIINAVTSWLEHPVASSCGETTWETRRFAVSRPIYRITSTPRKSERPGQLSLASRQTPPTIPVPTWRSKSTFPIPRSIARRSMPTSASPKFGESAGARRWLSNSSKRIGLMHPVDGEAGSCASVPRTSSAG